ncbi:L-ascorbate peroxidase, cytosolic [Senna tora]|uniref:L-ascorbate peroxidase, cytosolic n=1 Tax=Senna tora TaxID=362788 RepID=A0A835CE12_9FABA|nr:L-ascorbate peroxidase, cytosolic [Senna tora]
MICKNTNTNTKKIPKSVCLSFAQVNDKSGHTLNMSWSSKVWKELQTKVAKLPEAQHQKRELYSRRRANDYQAASQVGQNGQQENLRIQKKSKRCKPKRLWKTNRFGKEFRSARRLHR